MSATFLDYHISSYWFIYLFIYRLAIIQLVESCAHDNNLWISWKQRICWQAEQLSTSYENSTPGS